MYKKFVRSSTVGQVRKRKGLIVLGIWCILSVMKSKKVLFEKLGKIFPHKQPIKIGTCSISDETYGRQSMLYFWNIEEEWGYKRPDFENVLEGWGFKVNRRYCKGENCTEVQVSYFKGWHWDE